MPVDSARQAFRVNSRFLVNQFLATNNSLSVEIVKKPSRSDILVFLVGELVGL